MAWKKSAVSAFADFQAFAKVLGQSACAKFAFMDMLQEPTLNEKEAQAG
jgi:hypothetical protein